MGATSTSRRYIISSFAALSILSFSCHGLVPPSNTVGDPKIRPPQSSNNKYGVTEYFSVPLTVDQVRPEPKGFFATFDQLWNDPRPVTSLIGDALENSNNNDNNMENKDVDIPYCIVSDTFVIQDQHTFRILLYPRGRFAGSSSSSSSTSSARGTGPAAAYLRYIPDAYGDEVDISWKLRLVDTTANDGVTQQQSEADGLPIMTSGGLPKSNTTWSAAMTFCSEWEDIESVGRAADWGASTWYAQNVCDALVSGRLQAQGEMTVFDARSGESSFSLPPGGAVKATWEAATNAGGTAGYKDSSNRTTTLQQQQRTFRVGEVIVPMDTVKDAHTKKSLEDSFIIPGTDYRIMTMSDKYGTPIFSSDDVPISEQNDIRLALRPCGWKTQQQIWRTRGMITDWPVEVPASWLSSSALTRFNLATAFPRVASTFQRDRTAVLLGVLLALAPLPGALVGRNFVSLYAIPSASMDPTLMRGDVLLVEKFPGVFDRTKRGDVILFRPPSALREIIGNSNTNRNAISGSSLFVKRIVGLPGDQNIMLEPETNEVTVSGQRAIGPNRNLCDDEPLRLIDRLLENGKGKSIDQLGKDDVYVLGDCKAVSVDSRVFGVLPKSDIEGRPIGRIWPLSRFRIGPL